MMTVGSKEDELMLAKTMKNVVDRATTPPMKRSLLRVQAHLFDVHVAYRKMFGRLGPLPHFIVIGAQKSGTTYFYEELVKHPNIVPALTKEVHFFDVNDNYGKGIDWYRGFFPYKLMSNNQGREHESILITGEASPCYFFHPHAPQWILDAVPQAKLIVLLRNPVRRAYSHYQHEVKLGFETVTFEEAIAREPQRLFDEKEKMLADGTYWSYSFMHHAYLAWGRYVDYLKEWMRYFPREQLLIVQAEDFFHNRARVLRCVAEFLGLLDWEPQHYGKPAPSRYPKMNTKMRDYLSDYFEPYNRQLYKYLSVDFGWEQEKVPAV